MDTYKLAEAIVKKLAKAGYIAYFAGGWVRDFVMGHPSEDIDIATDAAPIEIMDLFPHTILVGLAFGVVIVTLDGHQFEVATFRKDLCYIDGRRPERIAMATPQEDAFRRDFTINGMFYDPIDEVIHDYVHGREDIKRRIIRTIGDPYERFFEDRLRLLRAFRFSSRFAFNIEPETQEAIREVSGKLFPAVAMERVWQEFNKMAIYPRFDQAIVEMHRLELLAVIFPEIQGMHIKDLQHLVSSYAHFPPACSTILYLMEIFPSLSLEQKIEASRRLKATNQDIKLLEFFDLVCKLVNQDRAGIAIESCEWIHVYADSRFKICIQVIAARESQAVRDALLKKHQERQTQLESHIKRIQEGKPLLSSTFLKNQGVLPGRVMGLLLKEAERIASNEDLHQPEAVFEKLKQMPLWKQIYHAK